MPATEMQLMEMDMVEGMYDTYELNSMDPPTYSVVLAATADDPPELRVTIIYETEDYPETAAPTVRLEHIAKHRRMQLTTLSKEIAELCEEQIGLHSVISVLQKAQEFLTEYAENEEKADLNRRGEALAHAAANASAGSSVPDPTVRIGTAVTRELFEEWSKKHKAEKLQARESVDKKVSNKLTGRQLWDSALKSTDWDLFAGGDANGFDDNVQDVDFDAISLGDDDDDDEGEEYDLDDPEEEE